MFINELAVYNLLLFIAGTYFGSFLNLVSDRIVNSKPILLGRSECDHCKKPLGVKNLVPLISFIVQNGKCSFCHKDLSYYYPFSEILTGLAFIFAANYSSLFIMGDALAIIDFIYILVIMFFYIILVLTDLKYRLLPDKIVFPAIIFVCLFLISVYIADIVSLYQNLNSTIFGKYLMAVGFWRQSMIDGLKSLGVLFISSLGIALFFLLLIIGTRGRGMGGGDVKLGFLIGLVNGFPQNLLAVFLGFVTGAVYSIGAIIRRKKTIKDTIAFGPFLILGSVISLVWGRMIIDWYINLL